MRSLEERVLGLEQRIAALESQLPVKFSEHIKDRRELSCPDIIREWFKFHDIVSSRAVFLETKGIYSEMSYRMAIYRMYKSGEILRVGFGMYRQTSNWISPCRPLRLSPEDQRAVAADTTHTHAELARQYKVSVTTIMKLGHRSSYGDNSRSPSRPISS